MIKIEPTTHDSLYAVANYMRFEDRREVYDAMGLKPYEALLASHKVSRDTFTFWDDWKPLCCVGLRTFSLTGGVASPWMLTTHHLLDHPRELLVYSKRATDRWAEQYTLLVNHVDARYTKAVNWVKKLGFEIYPAEPYGFSGLPFHRVERRS